MNAYERTARHRGVSYLRPLFEGPRAIVARAVEVIGDQAGTFDTLVGMGVSGTLALPTLAEHFGCNFAVVRKRGEGCHSGYPIEGTVGARCLFVDDLIDTGRTLYRVFDALREEYPMSELAGAYLYESRQFIQAEPLARRIEDYRSAHE